MIQIDLITGFLGSGKTTFLKYYAEYLIRSGYRVGIIENDFGAINIDMVMLQELEGEQCSVEQIVGGNVETDWKRRCKAKLIAMAMQGFDRVVIEPSGIYDVDVFFDVLYEEPVSHWYEVGNIFAIVDAALDKNLSKQANYLLTSQIANAGCVMLSKGKEVSSQRIEQTVLQLNQIAEQFHCDRVFENGKDVIEKDWSQLTDEDFQKLVTVGWRSADHEKLWFDHSEAFSSLFFMNVKRKADRLKDMIQQMMQDVDCGDILRVKGFVLTNEDTWLQINATKEQVTMQPIPKAQGVIIVIGQGLQEEKIKSYLEIEGK